MKIFLPLLILVFTFSATSQTANEGPITSFNNAGKLSNIQGLTDCTGNGHERFRGIIKKVQWDEKYQEIYFDLGNNTFQFSYGDLSNAVRSYLSLYIKNGHYVTVKGCAGGSNGVWTVIDINFVGMSKKKRSRNY